MRKASGIGVLVLAAALVARRVPGALAFKGMTGARRFLLGSVPNKVSHHAPCSVLIIRTT